MYTPPAFREARAEVLAAAMRAHPLATLVTNGWAQLEVSHIPMLYTPSANGAGLLCGHMARANPQWQNYAPESEALAIFSGPPHYVSAAWYPSTHEHGKQEHGKTVPTWNYVAVHARGTLRFHHDAAWLLANVSALTDAHESAVATAVTPPWRVEDAPRSYIAEMLVQIVGVEFTIATLEGKWKVSQNRSAADREGVIRALQGIGTGEALLMAGLVEDALKSPK